VEEKPFTDFLLLRGLDKDEIDSKISFVTMIEERLNSQVPGWTLDDVNGASTQSIVDSMIDRGENTIDNLQSLLLYAWMLKNNALYKHILQHLDGYEAFTNLYRKLAHTVGEDLRDIIFEDLQLPPLGLSSREKSLYTYRTLNRLGEIFEEETVRELLKDSLRDLPDSMYSENGHLYTIDCQKDLDCYLVKKGQRFIENLRGYKEANKLFFGQEINDDVIAFVEANREIGQGIREGDCIYETKIPYDTKAFLSETDPDMKRYYYCHCPWVRESIRFNALMVDPVFCQCSAGFHKKPYEVLFGQPLKSVVLKSVLNGDDICRFAIYLPSSVSTEKFHY